MSLHLFYREDADTTIEIVDGLEIGGFSVQHCAEEGRVGQGTITVSDPDGVLDFKGLRSIWLLEDEIESGDQIIWRGYTAERGITRGKSEITGAARVWEIGVVDQNSVLSRRLQVGNDAKRPAEKDTARIPWLIDTSEAGTFDDTSTYVHLDRPVSMDPADYRGQPNLGIFDDCAQQSGKNYWADYFNGVGIGVWYGHSGEPDYVASISVSNVHAESNDDSIFEPYIDAKLTRDPSRVFSGDYLSFDGGAIYRTRPATATEFAARDTASSTSNIKTAAKASKRALRYLEEMKDESDRVTFSLLLPASHVNKAKAGQLMQCHFSHLPGLQTFQSLRILSRTIGQLTHEFYKVDYEASVGDILPAAGNGSARLYFPFNRRGDGIDLNPDIVYDNTGDDPGLGRQYWPLVGDALAYHQHPDYPDDVWSGIDVLTDGTATITFSASLAAVVTTEVEAVFTILVNDDVVATVSVAEFHAGPGFFSKSEIVVAEDVELVEGDYIHTQIVTTGTFLGGYKCPAGTGFPNELLEVTGTFG